MTLTLVTRAEKECPDQGTLNRLTTLRAAEKAARLQAAEAYHTYLEANKEADALAIERLQIEKRIILPTTCPLHRPYVPRTPALTSTALFAQWALLTPEQLNAQLALLEKDQPRECSNIGRSEESEKV